MRYENTLSNNTHEGSGRVPWPGLGSVPSGTLRFLIPGKDNTSAQVGRGHEAGTEEGRKSLRTGQEVSRHHRCCCWAEVAL